MPSIFIESGSGQGALRNALFGSRIVARVFDDDGAWMPNEAVLFSLPTSLAQPTGTFPGGGFSFADVTDGNGRAQSEFIQADDLLGTWAGTISLVSDPSAKAWFYLRNEVTPFTPTLITITVGKTQKRAINTAYAPLTARLTDENGVGVQGSTMGIACPAGRGTFPNGLSSAGAVTNASGDATFPIFTANAVLGNCNPTASNAGVSPRQGSWETIDPAIPDGLVIQSGNNQHTPPNFLFGAPLVVKVVNEAGGPVAGVGVKFDAPNSGASIVWTSPATDPVTVSSDSNGLAISPTLSANAILGTYLVQAQLATPVVGVFAVNFQLTNGGAAPVPDSFALLISEA